MVTAAQFLEAAKRVSLRSVRVAGMDLHVRGLTGAERRLLRERATSGNPVQPNELVALATCDEAGAPMFTTEQVAEIDQVDGGVIEAVASEILKASGLMSDDQDAAAKN